MSNTACTKNEDNKTMTKQNTTGHRIKELLITLGWKKTAFADHAKINRSMLSHLIHNKRQLLPNMAIRIANATGASVDWLLTGEGDMMQPKPVVNIYDVMREAGASEFIARLFARYLEINANDREIFERVLQSVFQVGLDSFKQQAIAAISLLTEGNSLALQFGDNKPQK